MNNGGSMLGSACFSASRYEVSAFDLVVAGFTQSRPPRRPPVFHLKILPPADEWNLGWQRQPQTSRGWLKTTRVFLIVHWCYCTNYDWTNTKAWCLAFDSFHSAQDLSNPPEAFSRIFPRWKADKLHISLRCLLANFGKGKAIKRKQDIINTPILRYNDIRKRATRINTNFHKDHNQQRNKHDASRR